MGVWLCASNTVRSDEPAWHRVRSPAAGAPESIGEYAAGCLRGGRRLPLDGPGYQVMRPSRRRNFGHPSLVAFVRELASTAQADGLEGVLVGDLGQPRGGPAPNGHSSHQSGLDVDLWYAFPAQAKDKLPRKAREKLEAASVVDEKHKTLNEAWSPRMAKLLQLAANDERVARIFVNPLIKQVLCSAASGDRDFLSKLRPWYGHDDHFHVRLHCPKDSTLCKAQPALSDSDGCDELPAWLSDEAEAKRKEGQKRYQAKVGKASPLPPQCSEVLRAEPPNKN